MDNQALIYEIVEQIKSVQGVSAIVLGGSRARGTHTPTSDIDLGIYYDPNQPLDLQALNQIATDLDDSHRANLLTRFGGWGPWINGGGWLTIQGVPVDFLYRDLQRVRTVLEECLAGHVEIVYQPGHPHGFIPCIYMAEVALCQPLWQAQDEISMLKKQTQPYPVALQRALINKFAWEIEFSLANAKKAIAREDLVYAAGCAFRAVACMAQVLFALNQEYCLNEKGAVALIETFPVRPRDWQQRVTQAFQNLTTGKAGIAEGIHLLNELAQEVEQEREQYSSIKHGAIPL